MRTRILPRILVVVVLAVSVGLGGGPAPAHMAPAPDRAPAVPPAPAPRTSSVPAVLRGLRPLLATGDVPAAGSGTPGESQPPDYEAWSFVARCEEGGWVGASGPAYPDSLGISAAAWYAHGGGADTSPAAQIAVARAVVASLVGQVVQGVVVYPGFVPDWGGVCRGSW